MHILCKLFRLNFFRELQISDILLKPKKSDMSCNDSAHLTQFDPAFTDGLGIQPAFHLKVLTETFFSFVTLFVKPLINRRIHCCAHIRAHIFRRRKIHTTFKRRKARCNFAAPQRRNTVKKALLYKYKSKTKRLTSARAFLC